MSVVKYVLYGSFTISVVFSLVLSLGCSTAIPNLSLNDKPIIIQREVFPSMGFPSKRKFYIGYTEAGVPSEAFVRLFMVYSNSLLQLAKRDSFSGLLRLKTKENALNYCMFFTSMDTRWCFKDRKYYDVSVDDGNKSPLTINRSMAASIHFQSPVVAVTQDGFTIFRYVVDEAKNLFYLTEECKADGTFVQENAHYMGVVQEMIIPVIE